ncbi:MAG: proline racemase family protein [Actinomycetota bacterium]
MRVPEGLRVDTVDYHTAGEPFRIITSDVGAIEGGTILEKRRFVRENLDDIRKLLVYEPRGHADMYGCFVVEPNDATGDLGVLFFHNEGYSTACGHGTIALVTWALESGRVQPRGDKAILVDAPSGRLETFATIDDDDVTSVRFRNVPSFVYATDVAVTLAGERVTCDISYGGAFYASVESSRFGLSVTPKNVDDFIRIGRSIKAGIHAQMEVVNPVEPELRDVYGVIFYETLGREPLTQRNVTVFADGEVDRSPCGSGTSARLALLDASGELPRGSELIHHGIVNTVFSARVSGSAKVGDLPAVITEVEGSAHYTGSHSFVLEPQDEVGTGFLLR